MRINKCPACKTKIKGIVPECPNCGKKFMCKCGKELDDNKYSKCPICRTEASEKRKKVAKGVGVAVVTVASAAGAAAAANNKKKNLK